MDRQQEEDVLRITEQYVAEVQAGQQPRLSDYLVRYPHYADAITDFVTYYHAVEADLPQEAVSEACGAHFNSFAPAGELPQVSETSRAALERAWKRIEQHETVSTNLDTTLLSIANKQGLSVSQLADEIGLSSDIVEKLVGTRLLIDPATIPQEVLRRLTHVLHTPLSALQASMRRSSQGVDQLQIAEAHASYDAGQQQASHIQSFREAIEQSLQLTSEQKATWSDILAHEGL
jgi:ribosome-binding protein aMBF1 (putative translation factor)